MNRKILLSALLNLLLVTAAGAFQTNLHLTDVPAHPWDLILTRPEANSVNVSVVAYQDSDAYIEFGGASGSYSSSTSSQAILNGKSANFPISGLQSNTRYFYRLRFRAAGTTNYSASQEYSFITRRPPGNSFRFVMQADSHLDENTDPNIYVRALQNMAADNADFIVDLGDTFMTDKYTVYTDAYKQYIAQRYYFGLLCPTTPLLFALGNHDGEQGRYLNGNANNMTEWSIGNRKTFFPNPEPDSFYSGNSAPDPIAGTVQNYYAFQWGDGLFIVLDPFWNSNHSAGTDNWAFTLGSAQYQWLKQTLASSQARFKFIFLHHLVGGLDSSQRGGIEAAKFFEWGGYELDGTYTFPQKRPGWEMPIHQLLVKYNVSMVFHGHDHLFVKQDLDGIVYQEVPQPGFPRFNQAQSAAQYGYVNGTILGSPGHLRVTVNPERVNVDLVRPILPADETASKKNGQVDFTYQFAAPAVTPAVAVSAANYLGGTLAPEAIAALFGTSLSVVSQAAAAIPLPANIGGTSITVKDALGTQRTAPLLYVSPGQINFQIPPGCAPGAATLTVSLNGIAISSAAINIGPVSPGIFSATADGSGWAAANIQRVQGTNSVFEEVVAWDPVSSGFKPVPINFGQPSDEIYLLLYGTGIRGRSALSGVTAGIGGIDCQVVYAGPHCCYIGVDQVSIRLPRVLAGRGDVDVQVSVDGKPVNTVKINFLK